MKLLNSLNLKIVLGALLAGVLAVLATGAMAKPIVTWAPAKISIEIEQGTSKVVPVVLMSTEDIVDGTLSVVPAIAPYVSLSTTRINLRAGVPSTIEIQVNAPASEQSSLNFAGTLHLLAGANTISKPLPISMIMNWAQVTDSATGISFRIPPEFSLDKNGPYFDLKSNSDIALDLPSTMRIRAYTAPIEFQSLASDDALLAAATYRSLTAEDIILKSFHDGGLEVTATTFDSNHFFLYDAGTNTIVEITSRNKGRLSSSQFQEILSTLSF